jgi:hypothetical protein
MVTKSYSYSSNYSVNLSAFVNKDHVDDYQVTYVHVFLSSSFPLQPFQISRPDIEIKKSTLTSN